MLLLLSIMIVGTAGYILIEGYGVIDSLYMTVITISTVGFREIGPLSASGKIFTIFLIIISFGIFAYFITSAVRLIFEGVIHQTFKEYKVRRKIEKLNKHVIVCGYGRNGYQACVELAGHKENFVIVEKREHVVSRILEDPELLYVQGDASSEEVLDSAKIRNARALITALPNDADNMYVVLTAREMNPNLVIVSRASEFRSDMKLRRAGASNVIMPDRIGGQRMAKLVSQPDVVEFVENILLQQSRDVQLLEVSCEDIDEQNVQKPIRDLKIREQTGANLVGIKTGEGFFIFNPSPDVEISPVDKLFVLGTQGQIEKLRKLLRKNFQEISVD